MSEVTYGCNGRVFIRDSRSWTDPLATFQLLTNTFIHMSTPLLHLHSMTPKELYEGSNPNAMQRGEYREWNCLLPRRSLVQCEPTVYPREGIYIQVCHVSLCLLNKVNVSARLTRSPKITQCPMWLLASVQIG